MRKRSQNTNYHPSQAGNTLAEYAMLIGLVGIVSIIGLKALGGSSHQLLTGTGTRLEANSTLSVLKPTASSTSSAPELKGAGYYALVTDPATGIMSVQLVDGNQGIATNVTSIDGNQNTLGTLMIANKLHQLAQQETDPELKAYYGKLAYTSYFLGGAEGELDDVPGLDLDADKYNNGQALRDVMNNSQELSVLLKNPPTSLKNTAQFTEVMPLVVEVYNIAQSYKNSLSEFIKADGTVIGFASKEDGASGNGNPGSVLGTDDLIVGTKPGRASYDDVISYNSMRTRASRVLSDNKVESVPVESTLTDATVVYDMAQNP